MAEFTASRNNALPYPVYGLPYVVTFPLLDADGDPVSPSSPDSEISKNGDTFADCTNEAVEIATSSGICYLSLTGTELTTDIATVRIQSTGAKTTVLALYPRKLVSIRAGTSASAGSSTSTIVLDASASAVDDFYNGMIVAAVIDSVTEVRMITDYTGSTQTATVTPDWNTAPDNNDTFTVYRPDGVQIQQANVSHWNALATVDLPLAPTTAGRKLDVSAGGEAGIDWANVGSPTTSLALTGTTIASTQKVDVETIKTNPVVNAGTVTFPAGATLASTTNITAGTITTTTNLTNLPAIPANWLTANGITDGAITAAKFATAAIDSAVLASDAVIEIVTAVWANATRTLTSLSGLTVDTVTLVDTLTTYTGNTPQSGDAYALVNGRLTALRAGYLDNLSAGAVATAAQVSGLAVNTRCNLNVPVEIELPDASTQVFKIRLHLYDVEGNMEAPDSTPTIALTNAAGTDRSSRLSVAANPSTGVYTWDYTATAGDAEEQLVWVFTVVEGGFTRTYPATSYVVEESAYRFSSTDRANLNAILTDTAELQTDWTNGGRLDLIIDDILVDTAEIGAAGAGLTVLATAANLAIVAGYLDTEVAAILEDTGTTIPAQIAALNNLNSAQVQTAAAAALTAYDPPTNAEIEARTLLAAEYGTAANQTTILSKTNLIPASPAAVGSAMTLANGAITEATITTPAEAAGRPTGILGMIRRFFESRHNKRTRNRTTGVVTIRNAADDGDLEIATQSTSGVTDTMTKGV